MVEHFDECPLMRLLILFSEALRHTDCYILRQFEMLWHPLLRPSIKGTGHVQKFGHNSQLLPCPIWVGRFYHYQNKNSSIQKVFNVFKAGINEGKAASRKGGQDADNLPK